MDLSKVMILDTETTGISGEAQILQFSAVDGNGKTLVNEYFRPAGIMAWPEAERVNKISPEKVKNCRLFKEVGTQCRNLMRSMDAIIGWNLSYDMRLMRQSGVEPPNGPAYVDLMDPYSRMRGETNRGGSIRSQKLEAAAQDYGFDAGGAEMHNALTDVRATLHVFYNMFTDRRFQPPFGNVFALFLRSGGNCGMKRASLLECMEEGGGPRPGA